MCRWIIAVAAPLVPRWRRAEWREEWESEVAYAVEGRVHGPGRGDAVRLAVRCLGSVPHAVHLRAADWSVDMLMQDVRYALRALRRRPLFVLVAGSTLALGIGATTSMLALVNGVLVRPLPYPEPDRLMWVGSVFSGGDRAAVSPADFDDYRGESRTFAGLAAFGMMGTAAWTGGDRPTELAVVHVTANYLSTMGLAPVIGRGFSPEDEAASEPAVAMISESLWRIRFGRRAGVIGERLVLDAVPRTIIGVFPSTLRLPAGRDVLLPLPFGSAFFETRAAHFLRPIARLADGVTRAQAQADVDRIAERLEAAYPATNTTWRLRLVPLQEQLVGGVRPALAILLGSVLLVLLIACVNVANLTLASAAARRGELAVRASLGASRSRLARQLIIEALLISSAAGGVAVLLAHALLDAVRRFGPAGTPRLDEVSIDGTVLGAALLVATMVGVVFGALPLLRESDGTLTERLRSAGRGGGHSQRLRGTLVVAEVALSVLLVVGAALLGRSYARLSAVDPGFDPTQLLAARVQHPEARMAQAGRTAEVQRLIEERIAALPGVESVGATNALPIVESAGDTRAWAADRPPADGAWSGAQVRVVTPGYFATMRIPVARGRTFDRTDRADAELVVILNEAMAERFFPGEDPVGKVLMVGISEAYPMRIVGVVASVRQFGLGSAPAAEFYLPLTQAEGAAGRLATVVRTTGDPAAMARAVAAAIQEVDPDQAIGMLAPVAQLMSASVAQPRFRALTLGAFAVVALALAAIGVYGMLAHALASRRREIGIRMALGARRHTVVRMVVGRAMLLAGAGLLLGLVAAAGATRLLRSLLFGVEPLDFAAFAVAPAALATVALLASWIPARRAARVDPVAALRD